MMNIIFGMAQHSLQNEKSKNMWKIAREFGEWFMWFGVGQLCYKSIQL